MHCFFTLDIQSLLLLVILCFIKIFFFTADVIIGALVKDKTAVHIVYNEGNSSPIPFL